MYLTGIRGTYTAAGAANKKLLKSRGGRNVVAIGFVSLFTDISSEMVVAVLPLFLTTSLGFSILGFAAFEGLYQTASAAFRLWGGRIADNSSNPKKIASWGYGISTITRAGLFIATFLSQALALPFLFIDRIGKGIRVAPRDTIISRSVPQSTLATAFGMHRTLDTTGALLGPIAAFAILELLPQAFDSVFLASTMAGVVGFSIIILFVKNPNEVAPELNLPAATDKTQKPRLKEALKQKNIKALAAIAGLLSLATIGDPLIYLYILRTTSMDPSWFPLLYAGTALTFVITAIPIGIISDRIGFIKVFIFGQALLAPVYLWLGVGELGSYSILGILGILGIYYACTDGILAAIASATSSAATRGTALGAVGMLVVLAKFVSAVVFGLAWEMSQNPQAILRGYAVAVVITTIVGYLGLKRLLELGNAKEEQVSVPS